MRLMILRMISTNALSALGAANASPRLDAAGPIQRVRATPGQAGAKPEAPALKPAPAGAVLSGQPAPRGSLLDLSV